VLRIVLILIFLAAVLLQTVLRSIPIKELRRRARSQNDKKAAAIYKLAVLGNSAELFLYLAAGLSIGPLVLTAADYGWWIGMLAVLGILWLSWMLGPLKPTGERLFALAALLAPWVAVPVSLLQPVLRQPARWLARRRQNPTGVYDKEDLLDFIKLQRRQPGNRLSDDDLKLAIDALRFSDKTVAEIMKPRRGIKLVAANEPIGPMLMDELHQSAHTRYPVVKEATKTASPEIIGSLYIYDLLEHLESKGRIRDIMHPGANYINEEQNLRDALDGFAKSGQLLLVVVNSFEEIVGVITIEDVLQQIFGNKFHGSFDRYDDIRAIAAGNDGQPAEAKVE
jgi:CBS domain containing-hemolysin-like protein